MTTDSSPAANTTPPLKRQVRHRVSPEIAATVREEAEVLAAIRRTAEAVVQSAMASGNALLAAAQARHAAAMRPILRQLAIETDSVVVGTFGYGADTELLIEIAPPSTDEAPHAAN